MTWYITGNANIDPTKFLGTTNNQPLVIKTNQAADDSEKLRINPDGNVGIGKTPASGTPYKLDVAGAINATDIHKNGAPLRVSQWKNVSGGISYTAGNVGIGTTQPENAEEWNRVLDVLGADAGGTKLSVRTETVDAQVWAAAGEWWGAPAGMAVGTRSAHALSLATGGSSRMTVATSGNVGIGTTSPLSPLHVVRPELTNAILDIGSEHLTAVVGTEGSGLRFSDSNFFFVGSQPYANRNDDSAGNVHLAILSNGNVGVGTASPNSKLVVSGPSKAISMDASDNNPNVAGALAFNRNVTDGRIFNSGFTAYQLSAYKAGLYFEVYNGAGNVVAGQALAIASNGNVGVGTANPGARLDVSGSGGVAQCCAPVAPTLSLAEASSAANRQAWIQFHNAGEAEAYIRLAGGGPAGSSRQGPRRIEIGDSQGANTALQVLNNSNPLRFTAGWNGFPDAVLNQAEISNDTGTYKTLMIVGNRSAGVGRRVSVWDRFEVNGSAFKPGGGSWSAISDVRAKKNVVTLKGALEKLVRLRGVSFEWKDPREQGNLTGEQMGLVAQEVEEVFPGWISTDPNGYKNMTVRGFEALVVEAFKQLKAELEAVRAALGKE